MRLKVITSVIFCGFGTFLTSPVVSQPIESTFVSEPLDYQYFTSDWRCWAFKKCKGRIAEHSKKKMAQALESFLSETQKQVNIALYGVQAQGWFLEILQNNLIHGIKTTAVVDQSFGEHTDWAADNFVYADTALLPEILGNQNVAVDANKDKSPRKSSIMHHKFILRDYDSVWFGSANISHTCIGAEYNINNSLFIRSKVVNQYFRDEFEQMFVESRFSIRKHSNPRKKKLNFSDGSSLEVYFAPQDDPMRNAILPSLENAEESIDISMFYLTEQRVAKALEEAKKRGVAVRVILDATAASHPASVHKILRQHKIQVAVENLGGKMHMKSAIIDRTHFIIGSMNWTKAGNLENDEVVVLIKNHPDLANQALEEFDALWDFLNPKSILNTLTNIKDPRAESHDSINSCSDGIDNDHDGFIDSRDSGCQ